MTLELFDVSPLRASFYESRVSCFGKERGELGRMKSFLSSMLVPVSLLSNNRIPKRPTGSKKKIEACGLG